jgi:hypothetical protein
MNWQPRRFKPDYLRICALYWSGRTQKEIAEITGFSPIHVGNIIGCDESQEILRELSQRTLDTVLDVQTEAQAYAPLCLGEKFNLALNAKDERVRNIACTDILAMAGHQPVRRISVEKPDTVVKHYEGLTDDEIRSRVFADLGIKVDSERAEPPTPTVH